MRVRVNRVSGTPAALLFRVVRLAAQHFPG